MKKLLMLLASAGLTATTTMSVVACTNNNRSEIIKTALRDLHLKTLLSMPVTNSQAAFDLFIKSNLEVSDLHDSVQIINFDAPDYNQEGSLEVQAKTNTKYSGTLTITIPALNKTDIARLVTNTTIQGIENMTTDQAFQAILAANSSWTNLSDYAEVGGFNVPTYTSNGSLTINAKPNTEYTGSILVTIIAIGQTSLNDLNLKTLLSMPVTNSQAAFDLFIKSNLEVSDLHDSVQIINFDAPDYNKLGSLEIQAKSDTKYTGTLTITIPELNKTNITRLVTDTTIQGTKNMTAENAFQAVLTSNSSWTNLSDYVDYDADSFTAPSFTNNGSLTINAKPNTRYTGSILVTINAIAQKNLNDLELETTVAVDLQATQEEVFQAVLAKNQAILGTDLTLDQVDLSDFQPPQVLVNGNLTISAKKDVNNEWTGGIQVRIKYVLTEANFLDIFKYLSDNDLLQFEVPVGTIKTMGDLAVVAKNKLNNEMKQFYEYDQNITGFRLNSWAWNFPEGVNPSLADLNTPGYTLHLPRFMASIMMAHPDDSETEFKGYWNVYWTIVEK